jgi:hypothetical protein
MTELTTPKAVLIGFFLIAISIATLPITSSMLIRDAHAYDRAVASNLQEIAFAITNIDCS